MNIRCGRDEGVYDANRAPEGFTFGDDTPARVGDIRGDRYNSISKSAGQVVLKPGIEAIAPASRGQTINAVPQFCKCDHADVEPIFVGIGQPTDHTHIRFGLDPLRDQICIKQKIQKSTLRACCFDRFTLTRDPRKGDELRNSARLPTRFVLRSHSSAETITTVFRPLRVMTWGPADSARSITSLNLAFACATVHVSLAIAGHLYSQYGHYSHIALTVAQKTAPNPC
jgi:hypothetical protein